MENTQIKRPRLEAHFFEPSLLMSLTYVAYAICLYIIPAAGIYLTVSRVDALWLQVGLLVPLTFFAGYGFNMLGFIGHEGMHGNLFKNKNASAITGLFFSATVVSYLEMGFAMSHWNHHRFTNQSDDPDIKTVEHLKTWWQRVLFARLIYNIRYLKLTFGMAFKGENPTKVRMPYPHNSQVLFARLNILFSLMWLSLYVYLLTINPVVAFFCIVIPMLFTLVISACQTFLDHGGLGDGVFQNSWSRSSPLMTMLYFGSNYHMEHHAYPSVPCYKLPAVHKKLVESGFYDEVKPPIVEGYFEAFKAVAAPYEFSDKTGDFDAFEKPVKLDRMGYYAPGIAS